LQELYWNCAYAFEDEFVFAVNSTSAQGSGVTYLAPKVLHSCSKDIIKEVNNADAPDCWVDEEVIETIKLVYYLDCQEQNYYNSLVWSQYEDPNNNGGGQLLGIRTRLLIYS